MNGSSFGCASCLVQLLKRIEEKKHLNRFVNKKERRLLQHFNTTSPLFHHYTQVKLT